jgi:hypothetical protein
MSWNTWQILEASTAGCGSNQNWSCIANTSFNSASQVILKLQGDAFRNSIVEVETSDEGFIFLIKDVKKGKRCTSLELVSRRTEVGLNVVSTLRSRLCTVDAAWDRSQRWIRGESSAERSS